jgi:uncharacterized lipoprotein YddW (UPF0748 family)
MMRLLVLGVLSCVLGCGVAIGQTAKPEVRGTWLTTTANDAIHSPEKTAATMKRLRDIGLNVVYVECWKNGYTEFPSETMRKLVNVPMKINNTPADLQRDLLLETSIEAHRNGMLAIGWFEYGFMASFKDTNNELRALGEKEGFLTRNKAGEVVGKQSPFVWMNPLHPRSQQILLDIVLEAARNYDLDGVQLDDRIAMPVEMGYDDFTKQLYAAEHNGAMPPDDERDPAWVQWRADKITEYARKFAAEVRKANPNLIVSVSPAPYRWSLENYACDWPKWTKWAEGSGKWDEFIPQNYRFNFDRTKASIQECMDAISTEDRKRLIAGIRLVGDGPDMPHEDLVKSIEFTREAGLAGHVHWFSRGVLDIHAETLTKFYNVTQNGQATHPFRPVDWRMPAVVGSKGADGAWLMSVKVGGKYRIIERKGRSWVETKVVQVPVGDFRHVAEGATAVEMLVDRRP